MNDDILRDAIKTFGKRHQANMAVGEIGELLALFGREVQGRTTRDEWIDEIADITVMSRQLALMIGIEEVEDRVEFKIKRLQEKIEEEKKSQKFKNFVDKKNIIF